MQFEIEKRQKLGLGVIKQAPNGTKNFKFCMKYFCWFLLEVIQHESSYDFSLSPRYLLSGEIVLLKL